MKCLFDFLKASFGNVHFKHVDGKQNPADIFSRPSVNNFGVNNFRPKRATKQPSRLGITPSAAPTVSHSEPIPTNPQIVPFSPPSESTFAEPVVIENDGVVENVPGPELESVKITDKECEIPKNLADKIVKFHFSANCMPAKSVKMNLNRVSGFEDLELDTIKRALQNCPSCKQIENHVRPRPSSPGITLAKELTVQDCLFIYFYS